MSRIFNRPMFKRGGSAGEGITSGLARPGYALGNSVDIDEVIRLKEKMKPLYGEPPRGYNVNDFLIDWGLNMASATPQGNIISTGAAAAREPFKTLSKGKGDAEMAEYLSDVKATDQALGAVTDIAVARAKNQNLKDENEARAIGTIHAQVKKDYPNAGTFGNANSETIAWSRYKLRILGQNTDEPVIARVIEGDVDQGGAWALDDNGRWDYDVQKLAANLVWLDPLRKKYVIVQDTDKDGYGDGQPKEFSTYEEAKSYLDNARTVENITEESTGTGEKKVIDWETEVELEKFKDQPKFTEEYLREKFETYVQGLRNKQSIASQAGTGVQIMPDLSAEDTVFWRNYQNDPERAYQRWKNKITSWAGKQKKQMELSETIGANIDYGIKKADGGLMRNIKNIDEESANELQAWWDSQGFTN